MAAADMKGAAANKGNVTKSTHTAKVFDGRLKVPE